MFAPIGGATGAIQLPPAAPALDAYRDPVLYFSHPRRRPGGPFRLLALRPRPHEAPKDDVTAAGFHRDTACVDFGAPPEGFLDLGLNGSYMVVRELRQYVARFWQSLDDNAARIRSQDPSAAHVTANWLAVLILWTNFAEGKPTQIVRAA